MVAVTVPHRMADLDCASARTQAPADTVSIHAIWLFDTALSDATLDRFHQQLRRGVLGRVAARPYLGAAGDRWVRARRFAPVERYAGALPREHVTDWIAERARGELDTYGGPAWRLSVTDLDGGGSAVSLLVSHTLTDGLALIRALEDAAAPAPGEWSFESDRAGRLRLFCSDLLAAVRRLVALLPALPTVARFISESRQQPHHGSAAPPPMPQPATPTTDFTLPFVLAVVPADQWRKQAEARGGNDASLAVAVMAELATRVGRTDAQGRAKIAMPVSVREPGQDTRGNALGAIDLLVDRTGGNDDLAEIRAEVKRKLQRREADGRAYAALLELALVLPPSVFRKLARDLTKDQVTTGCSYVTCQGPTVRMVAGVAATMFSLGLITQRLESLDEVHRSGGYLFGGFVASDDAVCLRIQGLHPPNPLDRHQLSAAVGSILDGYGLDPVFL
ncbi:hypothetical protein F5X71_14225 [Nocardia brasiliensis]|uniref:Diacylglycerol O-acyltransferase n=1 Tax=Nocardia brasiliensis TaxID=37326 RepID=A0A6G9XR44_NOCBR|nr:hypothetical protein [Nocardia brasiliensis]QIS03320.1 hypothetical protein F5X71_14225 [Nocardia brasiliensis]